MARKTPGKKASERPPKKQSTAAAGPDHPVGAEEAGMRLDRLARRLYAKRPLSWVYRQIRTGAIGVDGKKRPQDYRLKEGERLTLPEPEAPKEKAKAPSRWEGPEPGTLIEREGWLALDKPAGLAVQGGAGTGPANVTGWLSWRYLDAHFTPAPAHRLDRQTSGLLLCAKKASVARLLREDFAAGRIEKDYLALVEGALKETLAVDAPLEKRSRQGPTRMGVSKGGRQSATQVTPLFSTGEFTLVRARPLTGRTHQIRVHLSHIGHPLAGDARYGGHAYPELGLAPQAFLLHAWQLFLPDPERSGEALYLEAPLPGRFARVLEKLGVDWRAALNKAARP